MKYDSLGRMIGTLDGIQSKTTYGNRSPSLYISHPNKGITNQSNNMTIYEVEKATYSSHASKKSQIVIAVTSTVASNTCALYIYFIFKPKNLCIQFILRNMY